MANHKTKLELTWIGKEHQPRLEPRILIEDPKIWCAPLSSTVRSVILGGMKMAVSVPDDVFEEAERLARRMKRSRSEVYSRALAEYVARHVPDRVTEAMDQALAEISVPVDEFAPTASRRILKRSAW